MTADFLLSRSRPLDAAAAPTVSVVVPVFNEEEVLPEFHRRLQAVLATLGESSEVVYVDDGSRDGSATLLHTLHALQPGVAVLRFSRNFGKEAAMTAGLELARGEAVILIDADLQDPPEQIPAMVAAWREGADVVNMRRRCRNEGACKKVTAHFFYRVLNRLSEVDIPADVGDFRLLSRRAVDALNRLPERTRFMKGLFAWIGFHQHTLYYDKNARAAGQSKWRYWKLWNFALEGITSFSTVPLKAASYAGLLCAASAFLYALYFFTKALVVGDAVQGFPTLIVTILFLGGLQLLGLGIIGEYLARLFVESKQRPLYLVDECLPATTAALPLSTIKNEQPIP